MNFSFRTIITNPFRFVKYFLQKEKFGAKNRRPEQFSKNGDSVRSGSFTKTMSFHKKIFSALMPVMAVYLQFVPGIAAGRLRPVRLPRRLQHSLHWFWRYR